MTEHEKRLEKLATLGWTCEHPGSLHNPVSQKKEHLRAVYLEGQINGTPREAYLSMWCGLVMLIRGEDFEFSHFIDLLEGRLRLPVERMQDDRQKGLFDLDTSED